MEIQKFLSCDGFPWLWAVFNFFKNSWDFLLPVPLQAYGSATKGCAAASQVTEHEGYSTLLRCWNMGWIHTRTHVVIVHDHGMLGPHRPHLKCCMHFRMLDLANHTKECVWEGERIWEMEWKDRIQCFLEWGHSGACWQCDFSGQPQTHLLNQNLWGGAWAAVF